MPTYEELRTLAFRLAPPPGEPLPYACWTLAFPESWKGPLRELAAARDGRPVDRVQIPIDSLNKALRALVPDLISIDRRAPWAGATSWLIGSQRIEPAHLMPIIHAWIRAEFAKLDVERLRRALVVLKENDLAWERVVVDLNDWHQAPNGTAEHGNGSLYLLLPDALAARLAATSIDFAFGPEPRRLLRVPGEVGGSGAELVSWPPLVHTDRRSREWPYSAVLRLTVQTIPFEPRPVVHCEVNLRRWATLPRGTKMRQLFLPPGGETSVYLRTMVPWLGEGEYGASFQIAPIAWRRDPAAGNGASGGISWSSALAPLLNQLTLRTPLPDPAALCEDPSAFLNPDGLPNAAIVYRNGMSPDHGVGAGWMPEDRRPIWEQIAKALADIVVPEDTLPRVKVALRARKMKSTQPAHGGALEEADGGVTAEQGTLRRAVAAATGGALSIDLLYQNDVLRDAVIAQVRDSLGLAMPRADANILDWETPELALTIRPRPLGAAGGALPLDPADGWRDERRRAAMQRRATEVVGLLPTSTGSMAAIVELGNAGHFMANPSADPKFAIRLGAASSGRVTQFLGLYDEERDIPEAPQQSARLDHRVEQAWRDTLRQLGVQTRGLMFNGARSALPEPLNYVGIWLIRQTRVGSPTGRSQQIPVLVWLASDSPEVRAFAPGLREWLPYPEALIALAKQDAFATRGRDDLRTLQFIEETLRRDVAPLGDVLLLTHAQNLRAAWPWLQNGRLFPDQLGFGAGTPEPITAWPGMRHVRVRTADDGETPECFGERNEEHGFTKGLWRIGDSGRVFGSTVGKPVTAMRASARHSKLGVSRSGGRLSRARPEMHAWNSSLVELTVAALQQDDDPALWAGLVHELRMVASHYDEATLLPLPLHLARQMVEYVIPMGAPSAFGEID